MYICIKTYTLCSVFSWEFPTYISWPGILRHIHFRRTSFKGSRLDKLMPNLYCFLLHGIVQPISFYTFPLYESLSIVIAQIFNNKNDFYACISKYVRNRPYFVHDNSFIKWSAIQVSYRKFSLEFRSYEYCQFIMYIRCVFIKRPLC